MTSTHQIKGEGYYMQFSMNYIQLNHLYYPEFLIILPVQVGMIYRLIKMVYI